MLESSIPYATIRMTNDRTDMPKNSQNTDPKPKITKSRDAPNSMKKAYHITDRLNVINVNIKMKGNNHTTFLLIWRFVLLNWGH